MGSVIVLVAIILVMVWYYSKHRKDLSALPLDIRWFYEDYYKDTSSWKKESKFSFTSADIYLASGEVVFYYKQLSPVSSDWERIISVFDGFCKGKDFVISAAYAIYNPSLVTAFINQL